MHGVVGGGEPAIIWRRFMTAALGRTAPAPKLEEIPLELDDLGLPPMDPALPGPDPAAVPVESPPAPPPPAVERPAPVDPTAR
jgi:penicillin-binding protein 1A